MDCDWRGTIAKRAGEQRAEPASQATFRHAVPCRCDMRIKPREPSGFSRSLAFSTPPAATCPLYVPVRPGGAPSGGPLRLAINERLTLLTHFGTLKRTFTFFFDHGRRNRGTSARP